MLKRILIFIVTFLAFAAPASSQAAAGSSVMTLPDVRIVRNDTTFNNADTNAHGFLPKLPGNVNVFLSGDGTFRTNSAGTATATNVTEGSLNFSNVTTADATTNQHGLFPRSFYNRFNDAMPVDVVVDFGADPTGLSDSTVVISNALKSVFGTYRTLYFPPGVYLSGKQTIQNKNNFRVLGIGATVIPNGTNAWQFYIAGCTNVIWDGLNLDGQMKAQIGFYGDVYNHNMDIGNATFANVFEDNILDAGGSGICYAFKLGLGTKDVFVHHCTFTNAQYSATGNVDRLSRLVGLIGASAATNDWIERVTFANCNFFNCAGDGTLTSVCDGDMLSLQDQVASANTGNVIIGCNFYHWTHRAVKVYGNGNTIALNHFNNEGGNTNTLAACTIFGKNNRFVDNDVKGIFYDAVQGFSSGGVTSEQNLITGNSIESTFSMAEVTNRSVIGIQTFTGATNYIIANNVIKNVNNGIRAQGAGDNINIHDNAISDVYSFPLVASFDPTIGAPTNVFPQNVQFVNNTVRSSNPTYAYLIDVAGGTNIYAWHNVGPAGTNGVTFWNAASGTHGFNGTPTVPTLGQGLQASFVTVNDDAYNATTWDGNTNVPTKNAIRDKIESLSLGGGGAPAGTMTSSGTFAAGDLPVASDATGTNYVADSGNLTHSTSTHVLSLKNAPAANTAPSAGIEVKDATAASSGNQQYSPFFAWEGQGWKTTATAASQSARARSYLVPVQGSSAPTATWTLDFLINGVLQSFPLTVTSAGALTISTITAQNSLSVSGGSGTASGSWTAGSSQSFILSGRSRMSSSADGAMEMFNNSATAVATLQANVANAAKTANYTVVATDAGKWFNNNGASGSVNFTLPTSAVGQHFHFYIDAAQTLTVTAAGSETIRISSSVSVGGGNITASTIGNVVHLFCPVAGKWIAESHEGTWTVN